MIHLICSRSASAFWRLVDVYDLRSVALLALVVGLGCSSPDVSGPGSTDLNQLPWTLALSAHGITLDTLPPYDTLQLTAVVRTLAGTPLAGAPAITFTSSDSSVRVSATGLLTARGPVTNVTVVATTVVQGIRASDTAMVTVTASSTPPMRLQQLQLQPLPGETATIPAPGGFSYYYVQPYKRLQTGALDVTGMPIPNALVAYRVTDVLQGALGDGGNLLTQITADPTIYLTIPSTQAAGHRVTVYAAATVYGVTAQDSLTVTITPRLLFVYTVLKASSTTGPTPAYTIGPTNPGIAVGGYVWWVNGTAPSADSSAHADSLDIVFDDSTAASADPDLHGNGFNSGAGNIAPFAENAKSDFFSGFRSRQFLRAGRFPFHSVRTGVSGTVVVQ